MTGLVAPLALAAQQQVAVSESDYKDLVFWGAILVVSMLVLFVAQKAIRFSVQSKIRSIHRQFAIRPDDLDRMAESGFLSDEERKRINEAIVRNLSKESREAVRSHTEAKVSAEALLRVELEKNKQAARKKGPAPGRTSPPNPPASTARAPHIEPAGLQPSWATQEAQPTAQTNGSFDESLAPPDPGGAKPPRPEAHPVDLELLLQRGMISQEEYERLQSGQTDESFDESLAPPNSSGSKPAEPEIRPMDLEILLERGMITREEYERLRSGQTDEVV